jgi:hypothetical protein
MPVNPPDKLRLLDAAIEALQRVEKPAADAPPAYETRIALSLLRTIRREIALADELTGVEHSALVSLLGKDGDVTALNDLLCERIRRRELDSDDPRLVHHLRRITLAKLAIDNPGYSAYLRAQRSQR